MGLLDLFFSGEEKNRKGYFDKGTTADKTRIRYAGNIARQIEKEFNTKVFDYGVATSNCQYFDFLTNISIGFLAKMKIQEVSYAYYFLIPIDSMDFVVSNDYADYLQEMSQFNQFTIMSAITAHQFYVEEKNNRTDSDVCCFVGSLVKKEVYQMGSYRPKNYQSEDNLVKGAQDIADLRYRFIKFFE